MTLSTKEIISSKRHVFLALSILIFFSGAIFGIAATSIFHFRFFLPMNPVHRMHSEFINKTAALASTPQKQEELKKYILQSFETLRKEKFKDIREEHIQEIESLKATIEKQLPPAKYKQLNIYVEELRQKIINFPPPPDMK